MASLEGWGSAIELHPLGPPGVAGRGHDDTYSRAGGSWGDEAEGFVGGLDGPAVEVGGQDGAGLRGGRRGNGRYGVQIGELHHLAVDQNSGSWADHVEGGELAPDDGTRLGQVEEFLRL